MNTTRRGTAIAFAATLGLLLTTTVISTPAAAAPTAATTAPGIECRGDACDNYQWQAARDNSYWGMTAGHNCTNYVAWRLIGDGVARPKVNLGNAQNWANNAYAGGYAIDDEPEVGAIAQWNANTGGAGALGHVAYIEKVYDDNTILVSEDYWRADGRGGPLTYRRVDMSQVSNVIHFSPETRILTETTVRDGRWASTPTELRILPDTMTALAVGEVPTLLYTRGGSLYEATRTETGWTAADTGLRTDADSLAAVDLARGSAYALAVENGTLNVLAGGWGGWQRVPTDLAVTGYVAAVAEGGLLPTALISQDGALYRAWNDAEGWQLANTGVAIDGPIRAVSPRPGVIEVFSERDGTLLRSLYENGWWYTDDTGLVADTVVAATSSAGRTVLIVRQATGLAEATLGERGAWNLRPLSGGDGAIPVGSRIAALDLGGSAPMILQTGFPRSVGDSPSRAPRGPAPLVPDDSPSPSPAAPVTPGATPTPEPTTTPEVPGTPEVPATPEKPEPGSPVEPTPGREPEPAPLEGETPRG